MIDYSSNSLSGYRILAKNHPVRRDDDSQSYVSTGAPEGDDTSPSIPMAKPGASEIPEALRPGRVLLDMFEVKRFLGAGGMGGVLQAWDRYLERDVAIKFVLPSLVARPEIRKRFHDEARTMARLRHPNVVAIHTRGEIEGIPFFVMEYIPGLDLRLFSLRRFALLPIDEVMHILGGICHGVDAIHSVGVLHRDLKPSNVLIGDDMRVAITDFGLAHLLETALEDESRSLPGTPAYMSPERIERAELTSASDIYSIAVMAYELFTGIKPIRGRTWQQVCLNHLDATPVHPAMIRSSLGHAAGDAIMSGLAKRASLRPPSAMAFYHELTDALQDRHDTVGPARLVVADDDPDMRMLMAEILRLNFPRMELELVGDGNEALVAVQRKPTALAIVDYQMPGMDGIQLTRAIRASSQVERLPILVTTSVGGAPEWRELWELGANAFLPKPFSPMDLLATVRRLIGAPAY